MNGLPPPEVIRPRPQLPLMVVGTAILRLRSRFPKPPAAPVSPSAQPITFDVEGSITYETVASIDLRDRQGRTLLEYHRWRHGLDRSHPCASGCHPIPEQW